MCSSCQSSDGTGWYYLWWGSSQAFFAHWQLLVVCKELVKQLELNWHLGSNGNFLIIQCSTIEADIHSHFRGSCSLPCYINNLTGTLFYFKLWWERERWTAIPQQLFVQFLAVTFKGCSLLSEMLAQIFARVIPRRSYWSRTCCGEGGIV